MSGGLGPRGPLVAMDICITRAPTITSVERPEQHTTIVAEDLAVRNFGGRLGRTELRFGRDGRLEHEVAII